MSVKHSNIWLYRWLLQCKQRPANGFTLIELLVSLLIASIVVSGLLFLVVELLRIDRREIALEQVQRDMQRAMDYISDDLREAVYVYPIASTVTDQLEDLDAELTANNAVPVLAFWRLDEIEEDLPDNCSTTSNETACELLKTRRATYTLVVYYQRPRYNNWVGESNIKRYEFTNYEDIATYDVRDGYIDPVEDNGTDFENWMTDTANAVGTESVLVDYMDALVTTSTVADQVNCRTLINDSNETLTGTAVGTDDYVLSPEEASSTTSFYTCIRNPTPDDGDTSSRSGQDVYIFLRGDAEGGGANFLQPSSQDSRLPILKSQVLVGGVINQESEN